MFYLAVGGFLPQSRLCYTCQIATSAGFAVIFVKREREVIARLAYSLHFPDSIVYLYGGLVFHEAKLRELEVVRKDRFLVGSWELVVGSREWNIIGSWNYLIYSSS